MKPSGEIIHAYDGGGFSYDTAGRVPFGVAFRNHYKFTGKERDTESGLDMFGARYYGSRAGGAPFLPRADIVTRGCPTLSRSVRKGGPG